MLAHQSASNEHLASILNVNRNAVASCLLSIQVFARVPIDSCLLGFVAQEEPQDGEAAEVVVGTVGELLLAVAEAEVAPAREVHLTLAVVLRIERTKPLQVQLDCIVALRVHVREGRAGVNECCGMRLTTIHQMIVHHDSAETHFEVIIRVQNFNPFDIVIWQGVWRRGRLWNVTSLVIASNLKISTVLPETHRKLSLIDDALLLHHVIYRLKSVQVLARPF